MLNIKTMNAKMDFFGLVLVFFLVLEISTSVDTQEDSYPRLKSVQIVSHQEHTTHWFFFIYFFFLKKFLADTHVLFWGHWYPCF